MGERDPRRARQGQRVGLSGRRPPPRSSTGSSAAPGRRLRSAGSDSTGVLPTEAHARADVTGAGSAPASAELLQERSAELAADRARRSATRSRATIRLLVPSRARARDRQELAAPGRPRLLPTAAAMEAARCTGAWRVSERRFGFGVVRQQPFEAVGPGSSFGAPPARRQGTPGGPRARRRPRVPEGPPAPRDPGEATFAVQHGLYWLTAQLSERRPVALIVDDAHWADAASLRFAVRLAGRLGELPVLLTVATRPDRADGARTCSTRSRDPGRPGRAPGRAEPGGDRGAHGAGPGRRRRGRLRARVPSLDRRQPAARRRLLRTLAAEHARRPPTAPRAWTPRRAVGAALGARAARRTAAGVRALARAVAVVGDGRRSSAARRSRSSIPARPPRPPARSRRSSCSTSRRRCGSPMRSCAAPSTRTCRAASGSRHARAAPAP